MGAEARVTVGLHRSGQRSPTKYPLDESATNEPEVTDLTEELGVWDGKSTAALQSIYRAIALTTTLLRQPWCSLLMPISNGRQPGC